MNRRVRSAVPQASLVALVLIAFASAALAAVPGQVSYQGLLLDDMGAPITGSVAMDFALYDAASGGVLVWSENHPSVQVVDGVYDVELGATTPITPSVVAGGSLHLEISVEGELLTPRQQLLVVPFAVRSAVAEDAEQLGGFSSAWFMEMLQHVNPDGGPPNLDPREGLGDTDSDGVANFVDPDNDNDGLSDSDEVAQGSDINLVTPDITGFSPTTADGFETTLVQVQGSRFEAGMTVVFGTETPTPTNLTATTFDVLVGPQPEGTATVTVTRTNGESVAESFDFFFLEPSVDSFSPSVFDQGQAGTVTVSGQNFITGMTVQFGAQTPTPTNITPTSFDVSIAGTEPPGFVSVTVTLPNGNQATNPNGFEVNTGAPRVIFLSSTEQDGDLGGLAGADAVCQGLATSAGLTGSFQAWLADSAESPATRETRAGAPYLRPDGAQIADDWTDLTDGTIDLPISVTETGSAPLGLLSVWSNVAAIGAGAGSVAHCTDWTVDATLGGRLGDGRSVDSTWTEIGTGIVCSAQRRLYCVEQ